MQVLIYLIRFQSFTAPSWLQVAIQQAVSSRFTVAWGWNTIAPTLTLWPRRWKQVMCTQCADALPVYFFLEILLPEQLQTSQYCKNSKYWDIYVWANSVDSDQTALRSSLIRIYTVCHSFYIFWRHNFNVKLNCFILRTTTVAGLGVPIFRVTCITVSVVQISVLWHIFQALWQRRWYYKLKCVQS